MNRRFSIIVPVYNAEKYLEECILSILNQTYSDFELILVDDGSIDKSGEICDEYAKKDRRIKIFHKANNGQLHTREYGISKASNEWLVFVDADDYIENFTLEKLNEKITQYDCDCIVYNFRKFNNKEIFFNGDILENELALKNKNELFRKLLPSSQYNSMWRKAVRKKCLGTRDYSKFYHMRISEDRLQSAEIFENASKVVFIDDILYNYRDNDTSVMNNIKPAMTVDLIVEEKLLNIVIKNDCFTENDFIDYRTFLIQKIVASIIFISISKILKKEKMCLLDKIKSFEIYDSFILNGKYHKSEIGQKHILFLLFKHRLYGIILLVGKAYNIIKRK